MKKIFNWILGLLHYLMLSQYPIIPLVFILFTVAAVIWDNTRDINWYTIGEISLYCGIGIIANEVIKWILRGLNNLIKK